MKFGLLYEHQLPRPWTREAEHALFHEALAQVELADRLGIDYVWEVEHHFLEEYAHSSAPEVFLAACAARTKKIRIGHGVVLAPPGYNHPARVAERIATLDLIASGRVDWGTGESASRAELEAFGIGPDDKKAMWAEGVEQTANMMTMEPYPGFNGRFFSMPCRNLVPKPYQTPHPPIWVACSRRETIHAAARAGIGALTFAFVDPAEAGKWAKEYYEIIKSDQCVPIGHAVNANVAMVTGFSCHENRQEALRRGAEGLQFFGYSLGHFYVYGDHRPGRTSVWDRFELARDGLPEIGHGSGIGTPAELTAHLRRYQESGVDQVIFIQQGGRNRHDHICDSLNLFAEKVMPVLKEGAAAREAKKQAELAPFIEAALKRKRRMAPIADADIPTISAYGRSVLNAGQATEGPTHHLNADITVMMNDPAAGKVAAAAGGD